MKKVINTLFILFGFFGTSQNENYTVINLSMNDDKPHFGLALDQNEKVLFTSYALNKSGRIKKSGSDPVLTLYNGQKSSSGEIKNVTPLHIDKKTGISHITSASYSPDGKNLYITTYYNKGNRPKGNFKATNFHIEIGEYVEEVGWTNFKVLPFCKPKYSYGHPTVTPDGTTLFFIANIRGGKENTKGPSDIFRVKILGDNTYSEPENLGAQVNSYSREMFPFFSKGNVLYFASNRPNGVGGFDIYKSIMNEDNTFEKAQLLPKPINSRASDFCLVIDEYAKEGYFASKRTGGKGDDDIYYFTFD